MGPETDDHANKGSTNLIRCYRRFDLPGDGNIHQTGITCVCVLTFEVNF